MASFILPGDHLPLNDDTPEIVIGPGIHQSVKTGQLLPSQAGFFSQQTKRNAEYIFIESNTVKYTPQPNDFVIGTVTGSFGEFYRVEISSFSAGALLSFMAFPNASRKNRPNLVKGDLVYARVSVVNPDMDTELECFDATTGKDGGFGLLSGGYVIDVKLGYARWLLTNKNNSLLEKLSASCKFEIAIGLNGKIWVQTEDLKTTLACAKILQNCQSLSPKDFDAEIKTVFKSLDI